MTATQGALLAHRYRLVGQVGRGGMGVVWLARDEVFGRDVAVKEVQVSPLLPREEQDALVRRTLHEAQIAARLHHPNVARVYDVVEADGRPWIVMEMVRARSLTQVVEEEGPLPPQRAVRLGLQVLSALSAAHAAGIMHRDVKPGNVLCAEDGRAVLTDFGIASLVTDPSVTSTGLLMGSPSYIAPERVRGRPATPASDLWSLAATLYTAVEGRPPYNRGGAVATVTAVATEEPDPFRLAGELAPVLARLLAKDPLRRPGAAEARKLLLALSDAETPVAAAPTASVPRPRPARIAHRWTPVAVLTAQGRLPLVTVAASVLLLLVGGSAVWGLIHPDLGGQGMPPAAAAVPPNPEAQPSPAPGAELAPLIQNPADPVTAAAANRLAGYRIPNHDERLDWPLNMPSAATQRSTAPGIPGSASPPGKPGGGTPAPPPPSPSPSSSEPPSDPPSTPPPSESPTASPSTEAAPSDSPSTDSSSPAADSPTPADSPGTPADSPGTSAAKDPGTA